MLNEKRLDRDDCAEWYWMECLLNGTLLNKVILNEMLLIKMLLNGSPSGHFDGISFNRNLFNMGALRATLMGFCFNRNLFNMGTLRATLMGNRLMGNRLMRNRLMGNSLKHISYRVLFVRKDCAIIVWKIISLSLPHAPKSQNLQDSQTLTVPYMSDFVANISFSYTKNYFTSVIKCTPVFPTNWWGMRYNRAGSPPFRN